MQKVDWSGLSESAIVDAAKDGFPDAFDVLVRRYRPAAVALARQIVPRPELAEDVAQDGLITAYKALPQLADPNKFAGWLGAIVRHRARRVSASREEAAMRLDEVILSVLPAFDEPLPVRTEVACEIARLEPELRSVAELYYLEEWSTAEIAEFLALPLTTVKWRLHESRRALRPRLARTLEIEL